MPNQIDASGIQIQSYAEIVNDLINGNGQVLGFKQIYGPDINTASNTPDGQMINIFALAKEDILDLIVQDYDAKDPDQAVGVALDGLSQLCGIARQGGSYTRIALVVTVSQDLNLNGLDTATPFTVSDSNGNLFYLIATSSLTTGANVLNFQSANIGFIQVLVNTITIPITIVYGVLSVNNPTTAYQIGQDQETDAEFRARRQISTSMPSQGYLQSLLAGLNTITGLAEAVVYENITNTVDANGVPAHSIWVIVDGGASADVAEMIYKYRNAGCGMKGSYSYNITQVDGTEFTVYFDRAIYQTLYIQFDIQSISGAAVDIDSVIAGLQDWTFGIYDPADTTMLGTKVQEINPDYYITNEGLSTDGITYSDLIYPALVYEKFVITPGSFKINGSSSSSSSSSSSRSSSSSSRSSSSSSSSSRSSSSRSSSSSSSSCRSSSSSSMSKSSSSSCRSSSSSSSY